MLGTTLQCTQNSGWQRGRAARWVLAPAGEASRKPGRCTNGFCREKPPWHQHDMTVIWGRQPTQFGAAGKRGLLAHWDDAGWRPHRATAAVDFTDLWGADDSHVWAVGPHGTIQRWDGATWSPDSAFLALMDRGLAAIAELAARARASRPAPQRSTAPSSSSPGRPLFRLPCGFEVAYEAHMAKHKRKSVEPAAQPATPGEASAAFARVRDAIAAVPAAQLVSINVDIPRAVSVVLGALPGITALMPELNQLPQLKGAGLAALRDYAFAAWFAHLAASPTESEADKQTLLAEAGPLRADLLVAAEALAHKGLVDATTVADIRSGSGNVDRANDLVALAALFTNAWERVHNKTTVTWQDVEKAAELGSRLFVALAERPANAPEAASVRARAFSLLVRTYDQARRGVTFLRWDEEDADTIAPSLYAGRQRRRASAEKPDAEPEAPTADAQPSA